MSAMTDFKRRPDRGPRHPRARQRHRHRPHHPGAVPQGGDLRGHGRARLRGRAQADPEHPFNQPAYEGASVLVVGQNFGCGSSREHAPAGAHALGHQAPSWAAPSARSSSATAPCSASRASRLDRRTSIWLQKAVGRDPQQPVTVDVEKQEVRVRRPGDQGARSRTGRATSSWRGRGTRPACCSRRATRSRPPRSACRTSAASSPVLGRSWRPSARRPSRSATRSTAPATGAPGRPAARLSRRRARLGRGRPARWPRRAAACWCPTCAATGRRGSSIPATPRMAQQAAIGQDLLDFMDALGLERVRLAGYDWGGRAACIAAILAPARVRALRHHRRLQRAEHAGPAAAGLRGGRARLLVPVVFQHRARAPGARAEPPRDLPAPVAGLVAGLALRRRHVRAHRGRLRQPRLRPGGDPLLPPPAPATRRATRASTRSSGGSPSGRASRCRP